MTQSIKEARPFTIVSLGKYPEIFSGLKENVDTYYGNGVGKIVVRDGRLIDESVTGWKVVDGPEQFNFSRNVNLGLKAVDPDHDVFFISDDVRLMGPDTIETLRFLSYGSDNIGLISPKVIGKADNPLQTNPPNVSSAVLSKRYIVFVSLYIRREVFDAVGYMDEDRFNGYGWDDVDFSRRVKNAGFSLAVAPSVSVIHGLGEARRGTETFIRSEKGYWENLDKQNAHNTKVFFDKWGDNNKE